MSRRTICCFIRIKRELLQQPFKKLSYISQLQNTNYLHRSHLRNEKNSNIRYVQTIPHCNFSSTQWQLSGQNVKSSGWPTAKLLVPASAMNGQSTNFSTVPSNDNPEKKPSLYQRFKKMYKEYWYVLVPVHLVTSAFWFGGFYYLAISGVDIIKLLELIGLPDSWVVTMRESKAGGVVTAYTLYKIATPARYTVTLGGTTISINYLQKWGWIKPIPSKEQLRVMYEDRKTALRDLKASYQEKMTVTKDEIKDEFIKTKKEITQQVSEAKTGLSVGFKEDVQGLAQGVKEAADEWRHIGKLVKKKAREMIEKKEQN